MAVIFDIKRFALHDGPGIRTTVFLKGCPLRCAWCHNPESHTADIEEYSSIRMVDGKEISMARKYGKQVDNFILVEELLKDRIFYEESGGGVTFSGGEPLMQHEVLTDLLKVLGDQGIHRAVDTSGHAAWEHLSAVAEQTDLFLYDLKLMDSDLHKKYTGFGNRLILDNAIRLLDMQKEVIFRVPVIPGINDTASEIAAMIAFLSEKRGRFNELHLLPYHRIGSDKYRRMNRDYLLKGVGSPNQEEMDKLKAKFETIGVKVTIGG